MEYVGSKSGKTIVALTAISYVEVFVDSIVLYMLEA